MPREGLPSVSSACSLGCSGSQQHSEDYSGKPDGATVKLLIALYGCCTGTPKSIITITDTHSYDETLQYDKNGNITHLERTGEFDDQAYTLDIDDLDYTYADDSNQLMEVSDSTASTKGFDDGNTEGDDLCVQLYRPPWQHQAELWL